jgi:hypothetical protein
MEQMGMGPGMMQPGGAPAAEGPMQQGNS